ncbi:MAG: hypothetical protein WAT66_14630 [Actinomycetota bacterium]
MARTLQQLVTATRESHLLGGQRQVVSRLTAAITTTTQVAITLTGTAPAPNSVLTIDSEDIYVISASGASTVDVVRGWNGTTPATHLINVLVYHNQKFPDWKIIDEINNELASLTSPSNGLFRPRTVSLTGVSGRVGYDLTGVGTDFIDVLSVDVRDLAGTITFAYRGSRYWDVKRNMPVADFPSGFGLFFRRAVPSAHTLLVTYAATYGRVAVANLATDIGTTTGIQETAEDILPLGAAINLLAGREPKRNFTEARPESRPAADVPPGAINASANGLRLRRLQRIGEERARLQGAYESYVQVLV